MDQLDRPVEEHFYPASDLRFFEDIWGKGFISPGGPKEVRRILENVNLKDKRVLDVGCGMGGIDLLLVTEYAASEVVGIDVEEPVLDKARKYASEAGLSDCVTFIQVKPGKFSFDDGTFDIVFTKDALLHVEEKEHIFGEINRVLKSNGVFVGSDWLSSENEKPSEAMKKYDALTYGEFHMVSQQYYENRLSQQGFTNISFNDRNDWYLVEAQRELNAVYDLKEEIVRECGEENYQNSWEDFWLALVGVLRSGELRPTHFIAEKVVE